jgi:hypothetical protein
MSSNEDVAFLCEKLDKDIRDILAGMQHLEHKATWRDAQLQQCGLVPATVGEFNLLCVQLDEQSFCRGTTLVFLDELLHHNRIACDSCTDDGILLLEEDDIVV